MSLSRNSLRIIFFTVITGEVFPIFVSGEK
jgi:hypothetical protein